jgi:glycosyltransferase involved in cell wall biosynthesis
MREKVLFLVTTLNGGGLENYVLRFLTYKNDLNTHIICKGGEIGALEAEFRHLQNVEIIVPLDFKHRRINSCYKLYQLCRKNQYDAVCDFTGSFAGIPLFVAKLGGIKQRISFYRNSTIPFEKTKLKMLYYAFVKKLTKQNATRILSNSQAAFDNLYGKNIDSRFSVIYNGVDSNLISTKSKDEIRQTLGIPKNVFVIGHTGRYTPPKNHDMIFKMAQRICNKYENVYFLIIGKGVPEHQPFNSSQQIICLDYSKNVMDLLKGMDLYYFPSITEGQPNALIEAMVSGLPIVASNIPPIQETVPEYLRKKLVSPYDEEANFNALEYCYLHRDNLTELVSKEWALHNYNASNKFEEFYKELINK